MKWSDNIKSTKGYIPKDPLDPDSFEPKSFSLVTVQPYACFNVTLTTSFYYAAAALENFLDP